MSEKTSGEFECQNGVKFRWIIQGERTPEIYGWLDRDHSILVGTGGFWRTSDPQEAFNRARACFPEFMGDA